MSARRPAPHSTGLLPEPPTRLIGRESEILAGQQALTGDNIRLLTLTGTGGVGKTRVALEIGRRLSASFVHGVCWVDLAPLLETDLVLSTFARRLGLTEAGHEPVLEQLQSFLRPRQVLLILDNVEHLSAAAPELGELLAACPLLRVLATSREPLHLRWEHELPVPPLPVPRSTDPLDPRQLLANPAVTLFVSRAQAVQPDFQLDARNAATVAEVCRSLDGLPLALELAAARVKLLPPAALLARLERRLDLLASAEHDRPARQQTLRSAIGWSYELLAADEQSLFRRLAVFPAGCSMAAAEAVSAGNLDTIASLVDKNLLRVDPASAVEPEPRLRMLESVRVYGVEQLLVRGELEATQQRHAAWCLALAEQFDREWRGPAPLAWLDRLDAEQDNLRAALTWSTSPGGDAHQGLRLAGALWWFWMLRGYLTEGRAWLARALAAAGPAGPTNARATALNAAGYLAVMHGETTAAWPALEESLALRLQSQDRRGIAMSLFSLGIAAYHGDDPTRARGFLEQALTDSQQLGDRVVQHLTLVILAQVARRQDDLPRAADLNEQALAIRRAEGDLWGVGKALLNLGMVARVQGELRRARALLAEGLELFDRLADPRSCALTLSELAAVAAAEQQAERSARLLGAAESLVERLGMRWTPERGRINADTLTEMRALVGPATVAAAATAGRSMALEDAIAEATAEPSVPGPRANGLTGREVEVLQLLARGLTSKEIAARLVVSVRTVEHHRANLLSKLGTRGRADLVAYATRRGWVGNR